MVLVIQIIFWLLLIGLDLWTKQAAVTALKGKPAIPLIDGVLEFLYVENRGAAFGMLQNAKWFFAAVAVTAIVFIGVFLIKMPATRRMLPMRICLIMISAGAAGNLIDRIRLSYVRDFIYFSLIDFPVFNVADMYVTVSTFLMVLLILLRYGDEDFSFINGLTVSENDLLSKQARTQENDKGALLSDPEAQAENGRDE